MTRKTTGEKIFGVFNASFMLILCVIMIYPYLNQVAVALNEGWDTAFGGITIFPRKFTLDNFKMVITNDMVFEASIISVLRVVLGTLLSLLVSTGAAYALSKKQLYGKKAIMTYLMIPSYISFGMIPSFILFRYLGLINNFGIYIFPRMFIFYNMIIIMSFMAGIPDEVEESAVVDGANDIIVFFKIIIPLSKPVLATIALWLCVEHWNDWITTLWYITEQKLYTLQFLMMKIVKESETIQALVQEMALYGGSTESITPPTPEAVKAATFIFVTLPIVMVYPFLQKYFVKGVTLGAVKG